MSLDQQSTHRQRRRTTRWTVRFADRIARVVITVGGIGTIAAVFLVFIFLLREAAPLFQSPVATPLGDAATSWVGPDPIHVGVDEHRLLGWAVFADGRLRIFRVDDGQTLSETPLFPGAAPTAWAFPPQGEQIAAGFADGSVVMGSIRPTTTFLRENKVTPELQKLQPDERTVHSGGIVLRTSQGQLRRHEIEVRIAPPIKTRRTVAVKLLDFVPTGNSMRVCLLDAAGKLAQFRLEATKNPVTEEIRYRLAGKVVELPYTASHHANAPSHLLLASGGSATYLAWPTGLLAHYNTNDFSKPYLVEEKKLFDNVNTHLRELRFILGRGTFVVGDSSGNLTAWFTVRDKNHGDEARLVAAHHFLPAPSAVTRVANSARNRIIAVGYEDGATRVYNVTTEALLVEAKEFSSPVRQLVLAPRDDGVLALGAGGWRHWYLDLKYPEAGARALFLPLWYENAAGPEHVWQSTGTDVSEPKMGLIPLIFGTLKATFYAMLLGAPLALLGAVYTSEFLHPNLKTRVKPLIELMASLPSVVLGFLGGLVLAPFVADHLSRVLATFLTIPWFVILASYLWQMLPAHWVIVLDRHRLWLLFFLVVPLGAATAIPLGPCLETWFFSGNLRQWLTGSMGSATGGWMMLCLPLTVAIVFGIIETFVNPWMRHSTYQWSRESFASLELGKFLVFSLVSLGVAWFISFLLTQLALDPRLPPESWWFGSYIGPYDTRNSLIVGFVMGFAVIPIIYTIAEDALSAVPEHLRSASLGAGATPWQTALRIVIPTAMSGLFSALMVGLGRAVGETMIVLMATGGTPIMDMSIFNGFRTLSANIATEMPEAAKGSGHYRTLFFTALVLFFMTFILNTIAELVRLRFRKRTYQL